MHILNIEHAVPDFESWKAAFDGDPIGRERSGVRRYRVMRASDDAGYVLIDRSSTTRVRRWLRTPHYASCGAASR